MAWPVCCQPEHGRLAFKLKREEEERHRVARLEAERHQHEADLRRWDEEKRRREEEERAKRFEAKVERWRRAQDIRAYVEAVSGLIESGVFDADRLQRCRDELAWAHRYAERLDPLSDLRGEEK